MMGSINVVPSSMKPTNIIVYNLWQGLLLCCIKSLYAGYYILWYICFRY